VLEDTAYRRLYRAAFLPVSTPIRLPNPASPLVGLVSISQTGTLPATCSVSTFLLFVRLLMEKEGREDSRAWALWRELKAPTCSVLLYRPVKERGGFGVDRSASSSLQCAPSAYKNVLPVEPFQADRVHLLVS
jgi:hypothetical protein